VGVSFKGKWDWKTAKGWLKGYSRDNGKRSEKGYSRDPLARGEGPGLSTELPDQELSPCKDILVRGSNED
jgi:hypothetical protein